NRKLLGSSIALGDYAAGHSCPSPCHHFEGGFNQSAAYNLPSFQAQSDNFEAICRTASDQDCRRHVATQIKARDWRQRGHVAELVGIEGGVVSGVINLESSGA